MSYGWFGDSGTSAIERLVLAIDRIGGLDAAAARRRCWTAGTTSSSRISRRHSRSSGTAKCATPLVALCVIAPPSSSFVTSSCVTVLITSGPVTNM